MRCWNRPGGSGQGSGVASRVVVYLLLAAVLFAELGYAQVWARMIAGLDGIGVADPGSSALAQARAGHWRGQ
jgi:hypothetical protein